MGGVEKGMKGKGGGGLKGIGNEEIRGRVG